MKINLVVSTLVLSASIFLTGCANKVHNYSVSADNLIEMRNISSTGLKFNLGDFTDNGRNEASLMCRLSSPVGTPTGETFATYIEEALRKELIIADLIDKDAQVVLTGVLKDIEGSTVIGNAYWEFDVIINSSNGKSMDIHSIYNYESSFSAYSACSEMQRSFVTAVQQLINIIITDPRFSGLINT